MLEIALAMSLAQESDNEVKKESTSIQSQQFEEIKMLEKAIAMSLDHEEEAGPKQVISILVSREKLISLCLSHRMTGRFWGNLKRKWNRFD